MRALLKDIGALTDGQRSALLLRELGGLSHEAVAEALGISTTSSRMLVHRARVALTDAAEARDTTCREVRDRLVAASDAGTRLARRDRRHLAGCAECRAFRRAHAGVERELSLLVPFAGGGSGLAALLKVFGGGGAAAGGGGAVAASTTAGGGGLAAKLTVGACCALLAGGGAAVGVKEATEQHHHQRPRTAEHRARAKPRAVAAAPAPAPSPSRDARRPQRAAAPAAARTTTTTAARPARSGRHDRQQPVSDSPTARPPAHEDPRTSVDLADLSGDTHARAARARAHGAAQDHHDRPRRPRRLTPPPPAAAQCRGVSTTDDAASQLDALVTRLERAAEQLRSGDVSPDAAATLVEDAASLASQASPSWSASRAAAAAEPHPGQDPLL